MNETELFTWLQTKLTGRTFRELPTLYPLDRMVEKNETLVGFIEAKGRNVTSTRYKETIVDASKWMHCIEHEQRHNVPVIIVFGYTDGIIKAVRPATYGTVRPLMVTPRTTSISANAGWERPAVYIPTDDMDYYGQIPNYRPSPSVKVPQKSGTPHVASTSEYKQVGDAITEKFGWKLTRMPRDYSLTWCGSTDANVHGWLDVEIHDEPFPEEMMQVDLKRWETACLHETTFANTESWIVDKYGNTIVAFRPSLVKQVTVISCEQGRPLTFAIPVALTQQILTSGKNNI